MAQTFPHPRFKANFTLLLDCLNLSYKRSEKIEKLKETK